MKARSYTPGEKAKALRWLATEIVGDGEMWEDGDYSVPHGGWVRSSRQVGCKQEQVTRWWNALDDAGRESYCKYAARTRARCRVTAARIMEASLEALGEMLEEPEKYKLRPGDHMAAIATMRAVIDGDMPPGEQLTQINLLVDGRPLAVASKAPPPPQIEGK